MSWIGVIALAAAAFAIAVFALHLQKSGWAVLGAVLMFALVGYALQGSPNTPSAPKPRAPDTNQTGEAVVEARRELFDPARPKPSYLTVSDGFARRGRFEEAAQLLRQGLASNPGDGESWLALANALVEHASGHVTPAALYAYGRADMALPANPGPAYFLGVAWVRSGRPQNAREVWTRLLENSPPDAPWREELTARIKQLDQMIAQMQAPTG